MSQDVIIIMPLHGHMSLSHDASSVSVTLCNSHLMSLISSLSSTFQCIPSSHQLVEHTLNQSIILIKHQLVPHYFFYSQATYEEQKNIVLTFLIDVHGYQWHYQTHTGLFHKIVMYHLLFMSLHLLSPVLGINSLKLMIKSNPYNSLKSTLSQTSKSKTSSHDDNEHFFSIVYAC